jgi:nitrous oxidase accessory protein
MKRTALVALLLILTFMFVSLPQIGLVKAESKMIIVPDDYVSIQDAIGNASKGDTVFVRKGVYVENPVINESISLVGEDRATTVIDVTAGLKVESNNVTITGLTIYDGWRGISLSASNCNISGNRITDATNGIVVVNGENNRITGNIFESIGLSSAIQLCYSNNNLLKNNYIDSCTEGIQLREGSSNNMVIENTITNCQDVAVRLLGSGIGTRWYGPDGNTIMRNNISNSRCGTTVYGSNKNIISNNNYVNNTFQFSANEWYFLTWGGNVSVNIIDSNYWSDYNGTDNNGDSIGDTPYVIDENNQDNHPLMNPVAFTWSEPIATPLPASSPTPVLTPEPTPSPEPTSTPEPQTESFPTTLVIATSVVIAVVGIGSVGYFKKRGH